MSLPIEPLSKQHSVKDPVNLTEFEIFASQAMSQNAHGYYASGANDMITLRENRAAFSRLRLLPRILIDVSKINTATTILGCPIASPICIAPTAMQKMAHPDGECATAKAAARHNTLMTLSSLSTISLEDVAASSPSGLKWFQLYVYKDRKVTLDLVRRAEKAGYRALAVTVDTPILGRREADIRNQFALPSHLTMGNFTSVGGKHSSGTKTVGAAGSGLGSYFTDLIDQTLNWKDVMWLRKVTSLKIVVKGIITAEDARDAVENGVDGIWVSNHGARQLDTTAATIEMLPEIVEAVAGSGVEIYLDGGIVRGTDVFKAIALGARAVFIGRPVLWGLSHSGEEGVHKVLQLLNEELVLAMKLAGAVALENIKPSHVRTALSLQSRL